MPSLPQSPENAPLPSTIAAPVEHELVIKKSRFLTLLHPVASVAEAESVIASVRKEHWDARHHCTALVVGTHADQQRSSDDGEPSGTAGIPMLEVLRHRHVTDLAAVLRREVMVEVTVDVPHAEAGRIGNVLHEWCQARGAVLEGAVYAAEATFRLLVPPALLAPLTADLASASSGAVSPVVGDGRVVDVPA